MRTRCPALMMVVLCVVVAGTQADCDDKPPKTSTGDQRDKAGQSKEFLELEKRLREESLADAKENDRLYKQMVQANPKDTRAWLQLGWNTAYNLSVNLQDVKERYAHSKRGIEHLLEGVGHNPTNAELYWNVGWYLHHRIGLMDDRQAFRALFRNDKEFHKLLAGHVDLKAVAGPDGLPDNFLVAQRWFEKTIAIVEKHGEPKDSTVLPVPLIVNSYPAVSQRTLAIAIEHEGLFGETAVNAWKQAQKMWEAFAEREFVVEGAKVRLKDSKSARLIVNYDYWKKRCEAEQTEALLTARQAAYRVKQHLAKQRAEVTDEARAQTKQLFDQAFRAWVKVDKQHPWLLEQENELEGLIHRYRQDILNGKPLPDDFPLRHIQSRSPRAP